LEATTTTPNQQLPTTTNIKQPPQARPHYHHYHHHHNFKCHYQADIFSYLLALKIAKQHAITYLESLTDLSDSHSGTVISIGDSERLVEN
jgi:hydroxymethylpyrimidine pyrophosphatase-like HAD family hydrolase